MLITIRLRTLLWLVTGALLALVTSMLLMQAWRVDAAPGDDDATFVPITACRLVDTRPADPVGPRNTPLGAAETYTVDVQHPSTGCVDRIPADANGLVLNVTAAQTGELTFVTIWDDGPLPESSALNPAPGPPVPNGITTKLSESDTFKIYNDVGSTHLIIDVTGYYTSKSLIELDQRLGALELSGVDAATLARITELESDVEELRSDRDDLHEQNAALADRLADVEGTTDYISVETLQGHPTLTFDGVNVRVTNGTGSTSDEMNGLGNLIVGYNENVPGANRDGSHNLVVGVNHGYESYGGAVLGLQNTVSGAYATVLGGFLNVADGSFSSVAGGNLNTASGDFSHVGGGSSSTAAAPNESISGDTGMPFVVSTGPQFPYQIDQTPVVTLPLTAPADGRFTVVASGAVGTAAVSGGHATCQISESESLAPPDGVDPEAALVSWYGISPNVSESTHTLVRNYDVAAGETLEPGLICAAYDAGSMWLYGAELTAIFTPAA